MKKFTLLSVSMVVFALTAFSQEKTQSNNCDNVKNGTYRLKHSVFNFFGETYIIKREDDKQIEVDSYGDKYIFNVDWISDCSYRLTLQQIVNNPGHIEFSEKPILVEITEVTAKGYKNKVTMDISGSKVVRMNTMVKESPNQHKELQELLNNE